MVGLDLCELVSNQVERLLPACLDQNAVPAHQRVRQPVLVVDKVVDTLKMQPTKGIARKTINILGQDIVIHDFGGQKKYRDDYAARPAVFSDTEALIYVIDLQDKERYEESYKYFGITLEGLRVEGVTPKIFILLHKHDSDYLKEYKGNSKKV